MTILDNSTLIFGILIAIASALVSWLLGRRSIPRSHRVAVIGFPQAGKTSLIVALFAYYFRASVQGAQILPRGEETIHRVNKHIAEMDSGKGVSPTRDQDLFAFRAEVLRRSAIAILERRYKLEIGDFPGEHSEEFITSEQPWLHNTSYFEWAMSADVFIFVVDASKAWIEGDEYISKQKGAFRAALQRIEEHHIDGVRRLRKMVAMLVYTKADVLIDLSDGRGVRDCVVLKNELDRRFEDLRDYFKQSFPRFETVLTSVYGADALRREGIRRVAELTVPSKY